MEPYDKLKDMLIKHEGLRLKPYICPAGKLTIGVGRNIEGVGISKGEAMLLLYNDIDRVKQELKSVFGQLFFDALPENIRLVLIDMCFNLGKTKFLKFRKMIAAVEAHDWYAMTVEIKNSRWYNQVENRAKDLIKLAEECNNGDNR